MGTEAQNSSASCPSLDSGRCAESEESGLPGHSARGHPSSQGRRGQARPQGCFSLEGHRSSLGEVSPVPQSHQMVPAVLGRADSVVQWWELTSWEQKALDSEHAPWHLCSERVCWQCSLASRSVGLEPRLGRGPAAPGRRCWGSARAPTASWDSGWSADWEGSGQRGTGWLAGGSQRSKTRDIKMTEWTGHATQLVAAFSPGSGIGPGFESWPQFLAAV